MLVGLGDVTGGLTPPLKIAFIFNLALHNAISVQKQCPATAFG